MSSKKTRNGTKTYPGLELKPHEEELKLQIDAGIPAIYVETTEWERFEATLERVSNDSDKDIRCWNPLSGFEGDDDDDCTDFISLIRKLSGEYAVPDWDITVIEHADRYFQDPDPMIMFAVMLKKLRKIDHQIIVVAPSLHLPDAIRQEFSIIEFPLPDRDDIETILTNVITGSMADSHNDILDSVRGLGTTEIRNAFAKVAKRHGKITAEEIVHLVAEKEQIIRKSGYLDFIKPDKGMDDIGGLENLKAWLKTRQIAFGAKARRQNLQAPKGVLLLGIPGTGKSLSAKSVASVWKMPLLRLDMARIFGGLVGESEANMRNTIKVAESMEPCVLWIDEIEKGLSGGQGGERDGGTSARVFGTFLTWMQEKQKEVFIFATANDVSKLPPELLRKGRFDEIFFVDLPDQDARESIFKIHLSLKQQNKKIPDDLLEQTEGFSGAEIETIVNEAHFKAHEDKYNAGNDSQDNPLIACTHLIDATGSIVPLAKTMKEDIERLRDWAKARCRAASDSKNPPKIPTGDQYIRLPQEETNIFIKRNTSKDQ